MNSIKILNNKEKKKIETQLREQFGIEKIPGILLKRGHERIFFFSGDFNENTLSRLEKATFIERVGVYFAKIVNDDIKLSIEGVQLLKDQIKKNVFELDESQVEFWMSGSDLQIKTGKHGFLAIKYKDAFLGVGKASEEKIGNFIPKSRRLKNKQS